MTTSILREIAAVPELFETLRIRVMGGAEPKTLALAPMFTDTALMDVIRDTGSA